MPRDIMIDLEAVGDRLLKIKEAIENGEYDPRRDTDMQLAEIARQVEELRGIMGEWVFDNLPREKQEAALL